MNTKRHVCLGAMALLLGTILLIGTASKAWAQNPGDAAPNAAAFLPGVKDKDGDGFPDKSTGYQPGGSASDYNGHSIPTDWLVGSPKAAAALGLPKDMANFLYEIAERRRQITQRKDPLLRWGEVSSYILQHECRIDHIILWEAWSLEILTYLTKENKRLEKAIEEMDQETLDALKNIVKTIADEILKRIPANASAGFKTDDILKLMKGEITAAQIKGAVSGSGWYAELEGPKIAKSVNLLIDIGDNIGQGKYLDALIALGKLMGSQFADLIGNHLNLHKALASLLNDLWRIQISTAEEYSSKVSINVNRKLMAWGGFFFSIAKDCGDKLKAAKTYPGQVPSDTSPECQSPTTAKTLLGGQTYKCECQADDEAASQQDGTLRCQNPQQRAADSVMGGQSNAQDAALAEFFMRERARYYGLDGHEDVSRGVVNQYERLFNDNPPLLIPAERGACDADYLFIPRDHFELTEDRTVYPLKRTGGDFSRGGCLFTGSNQALYDLDEIHDLLQTSGRR